MKDLLQDFRVFIDTEALFAPGDNLLLAVSGGVDSVALCELCNQSGYSFTIAHCNFKLRGEESERDETFVRLLGEKYKVPVLVKEFNTIQYAEEQKISIQVAARELRYAWFTEIAGTQYKIVTAHHADDNMETVLMNFFKGTGIAGIRGILPRRDNLVRPLLFAPKVRLLDFAAAHQLKYVEDSSNLTDKYTRNYFRQHIIPAVLKVFPEAENGIQENIERFRETQMLYDQAIALHKKKLVEQKGEELHIPVLKLQQAIPLKTILYEIIKEYQFSSKQTDEIMDLLQSESGRYVLSPTHRILKNRNWLVITPLPALPEGELSVVVISNQQQTVPFAGGILNLKEKNCDSAMLNEKHQHIACLDAAAIQYPLLLRKWKPGDYFYPLGMKKKKKLSRFFIDQKLSLAGKEKAWVLEMNKKIIWVVNHRIDDRFKITASTKNCLRIEFYRTGA